MTETSSEYGFVDKKALTYRKVRAGHSEKMVPWQPHFHQKLFTKILTSRFPDSQIFASPRLLNQPDALRM
jgi:hypothetical protein